MLSGFEGTPTSGQRPTVRQYNYTAYDHAVKDRPRHRHHIHTYRSVLCRPSALRLAAYFVDTCGAICLTPGGAPSRLLRRATSRSSATRSATRRSARPFPITISGSGATRSVQCSGTAQTVSSSIASKSRLPYRLDRSATHTNGCPRYGWNGWVIRTTRVDTTEETAFRVELQAIVQRAVWLVAGERQ